MRSRASRGTAPPQLGCRTLHMRLWRYSPDDLPGNITAMGARLGDTDHVTTVVAHNGPGGPGRLAIGRRHLFYAEQGSAMPIGAAMAGVVAVAGGLVTWPGTVAVVLLLLGAGLLTGGVSFLAAFRLRQWVLIV